MKIFISGGCKNGKSTTAERIAMQLAGKGKLYYVATMLPVDAEDRARIARHRRTREGQGFETVEKGKDIACLHDCCADASYLLDSVTALYANEMFLPDGQIVQDAHRKVSRDILKLMGSVRDMIIVSDFICADHGRYDELTKRYQRGLAFIDRQLANHCDVVLEICYASPIVHKGGEHIRAYLL